MQRLTSRIVAAGVTTLLLSVVVVAQQTQNYVAKFNASGVAVNTSAPIFDNNGMVGIGTSTPSEVLQVNGNILLTGQTTHTLKLQGTATSGRFGQDSVGLFASSDTSGAAFRILTTNSGTLNEWLRVTAAGLIGIGTAAPRTITDVIGPNATLNIDHNAGNAGTVGIQLLHVNGGSTQQKVAILSDAVGSWGRGNLRFAVNINGDTSNASTTDTKLYVDGSSGHVGIATTSPGEVLEVNGNIKVTAGSGKGIVFQDATNQTTAWTGVLCGGDYAESVKVSNDRALYEPGDVLEIDGDHPGSFIKSSTPYSTGVVGVYSTKPGVIGRRSSDPEQAKSEVPMAMIGIVPVKVTAENGPIKPKDLLVTSSLPGYAMKGTDSSRMTGAVVGKALGTLDSGTGVIEAVVALQ